MPHEFDFEGLRAIQEPVPMPNIPVVMCDQCKKPAYVRVIYDGQWEEYVIAVSCHGEVQGAAIRHTVKGGDYSLIFSLIDNLKSCFGEQT